MQPKTIKLYIREADGTTSQIQYQKNKKIIQILQSVYKESFSEDAVVICKGKLLSLSTTVGECQINENSILHLFRKSKKQSERVKPFVYLSYQQKLYKIQFEQNESIQNFKSNVFQSTSVPVHRQGLAYRTFDLQDFKTLKQYGIKNEDILFLNQIDPQFCKFYPNDMCLNVFSNKMSTKNRRGSEGEVLKKQILLKDTKQQKNNFFNSGINLSCKPVQNCLQPNLNQNNNKKQIFSPSLIYGPSCSQLSEAEEDPEMNPILLQDKMLSSPVLSKIGFKMTQQENFQLSMNSFIFNTNIFCNSNNNSDAINPLVFKEDETTKKCQDIQQTQPLDFQKALFDILDEPDVQEVVLCSSHYFEQGEEKENEACTNQTQIHSIQLKYKHQNKQSGEILISSSSLKKDSKIQNNIQSIPILPMDEKHDILK